MQVMDSRAALIDAAKDLMWERGYSGMTPRAVLTRSGLGQGSLYYHFPTKHALAEAALVSRSENMRDAVAALRDRRRTGLLRVERYLRSERDVLRGCPIGRLVYDSSVAESPALQALVADFFSELGSAIESALRDAQQEGEIAAWVSPRDITRGLMAIVQGGYILSRASGKAADFHGAVRGGISMLRSLSSPDTDTEGGPDGSTALARPAHS
jgi:TetR/AcrR family transcriptional repressor of nem operon